MTSTYDILGYDSDEERQKNPDGPPRKNLFAAATDITLLLSANDIEYAAIWGFAMICRGSTRISSDVDVIVNTSLSRLWEIIRQQPR
jgi:predicted nucleotidyltransferase